MSIINYDKVDGLIYTEKSNQQIVDGKYYFRISKNCSKNDIKSLVKKIFNVEVGKVNIMNVKGKRKKFKGIFGVRKSYKKAIITLIKGQSIDLQNLKIKDGN